MSDRISTSGLSLRHTKSESNIWNSILSLDAKYNHYRIQNAQLRTLYMRRKTQLLREQANKSKNSNKEPRQFNYNIRSQIFEHRFGLQDTKSLNSLGTRHSKSQSLDSAQWREHYRRVFTNNKKFSSIYSSETSLNSENSTIKARQRTLEEQYAFAGVYHIFDHHKLSVSKIRFANNDKSLLATCSLDGTLAICQLVPSPATIIYKSQGHTAGINDMQFSSTNDLIVTASSDGTSRVWQVSKGNCVRILKDTSSTEVLCCSFFPLNENMIITGNAKGLIQVYNSSTGILANKSSLHKVSAKAQCMCFDSSGANLWIGDNKGGITSFHFDILNLMLTNMQKLVSNRGYSITSIAHKQSLNSLLICNAAPNYLLLYKTVPSGLKLSKRICIKQSMNLSMKSSFAPMIVQQDKSCVVCTGSEDCCVYVYDMECESKPLINRLQGHSSSVLDVCFNYDESLMASGDAQGTIIVWKRDDNVRTFS